MSILAEVLEALYLAPRCRTLQGSITWRVDWATRQQHSGNRVTLLAVGADSSEAHSPATYQVWVDHLAGRLRIDAASSVTVIEDDVQLMYHPQSGAIRTVQTRRFGWPDALWAGRGLLSACTLAVDGVSDYLNRSCWQVRALPDHQENLFPGLLVDGDRMELTVDQQTGVILRHHARTDDGTTVSDHEWTAVNVDVDIPDVIFTDAIPADAPVRTAGEMTLHHLAERGYDVTGIDPNDEEAVRDAFRRRPGHNPLDQYVADGPPPADPDTARAAIVDAFASFATRVGGDLPHVEAGNGLGQILDRVAARYPNLNAALDVSDVKFLNDHEAAVTATVVDQHGQRMLGPGVQRAVYRDRRWKLARNSLASLLGFIGIYLPPPEAGTTR